MRYSPYEETFNCPDGVKRKIIIEQDECGREDPLEDDPWCELVTMSDNRRTLGHKRVDLEWIETSQGRVPYLDGDEELGFEDKQPICVIAAGRYGGNELTTDDPEDGPPNRSEWYRSQIGWIWVDAAGFKEWSGEEWVNCKDNRERIAAALKSVVEYYSSWLNGDVWGYRIQKLVSCVPECTCGRDPTWEDDDQQSGCWGFIGDWEECGILDDARSAIGVDTPKKEPPPEPRWRREHYLVKEE